MTIYVIYESNTEVIVSTLEDEHIVLKEYFKNGGRDLEDYERMISNAPVSICSRLYID